MNKLISLAVVAALSLPAAACNNNLSVVQTTRTTTDVSVKGSPNSPHLVDETGRTPFTYCMPGQDMLKRWVPLSVWSTDGNRWEATCVPKGSVPPPQAAPLPVVKKSVPPPAAKKNVDPSPSRRHRRVAAAYTAFRSPPAQCPCTSEQAEPDPGDYQ